MSEVGKNISIEVQKLYKDCQNRRAFPFWKCECVAENYKSFLITENKNVRLLELKAKSYTDSCLSSEKIQRYYKNERCPKYNKRVARHLSRVSGKSEKKKNWTKKIHGSITDCQCFSRSIAEEIIKDPSWLKRPRNIYGIERKNADKCPIE